MSGELRTRAGVLATVAILVLGAACSSDEGGGAPLEDSAGERDDTSATAGEDDAGDGEEIAGVEATYDAGPCPEGVAAVEPITVTCGSLTVPERHEDPDGRR